MFVPKSSFYFPVTLNQALFKYRSYTPLPFVILMLLFAQPTWQSLAIGFIIAGLGEAMRAWGVCYAGSETRVTGHVGASRLVTSGPFARVRNPLYLGNMTLYLGVGIMSMALFPWLPLAALAWFIFQYTLIVQEEEAFLAREFGEEYAEYRRNVPRFLLRPTAWRSPRPIPIDWKSGLHSEARTLQAFSLVTVILVVIHLLQ